MYTDYEFYKKKKKKKKKKDLELSADIFLKDTSCLKLKLFILSSFVWTGVINTLLHSWVYFGDIYILKCYLETVMISNIIKKSPNLPLCKFPVYLFYFGLLSCVRNSAHSFVPIVLKLCSCLFFMVGGCACALNIIVRFFLVTFSTL